MVTLDHTIVEEMKSIQTEKCGFLTMFPQFYISYIYCMIHLDNKVGMETFEKSVDQLIILLSEMRKQRDIHNEVQLIENCLKSLVAIIKGFYPTKSYSVTFKRLDTLWQMSSTIKPAMFSSVGKRIENTLCKETSLWFPKIQKLQTSLSKVIHYNIF